MRQHKAPRHPTATASVKHTVTMCDHVVRKVVLNQMNIFHNSMTCVAVADLQLTGSCWVLAGLHHCEMSSLSNIRSTLLSCCFSTHDRLALSPAEHTECDSLFKLFPSKDVATFANNDRKKGYSSSFRIPHFHGYELYQGNPGVCLSSWKRVLASGFCRLDQFCSAKRR